ncbi:MAG: homocysteine S-methyltransferase family protein [Candidatus Heimdallarchaeota archaeon]
MTKPSVLELIKQRVLVLDGAMGSMLISQGLPAGLPPENWNVTNPEKVRKAHEGYFTAGSDAVLTNTFGGSRLKLDAHGFGDKVKEYNLSAVELAREVCPDEDFYETFLEQAKILATAKVDFFFVETMMDVKEAEAAVKAIKKVSNVPIFVSITYQKTKRGYFTIMGDTVEDCVEILTQAGADVIGANCTIGSDEMIDLVPLLKEHSKKPILVKPNAGKPQLVSGKTIYPTSASDFARDISQMVELGARIVGGCCGTNPLFISKIVEQVKE